MQSEKVADGKKTYCFAIHNASQKIPKICGLSIKDFSKLVAKFGGNAAQDALLLAEHSEDELIKRSTNGANRKCVLIPYTIMRSESWCRLCVLFDEEKLMQLVDEETPSGVLTQSLPPAESTRTDDEHPSLEGAIGGLSLSQISHTTAAPDTAPSVESSDSGTGTGSGNSHLFCTPCNRSFKSQANLRRHESSKTCKKPK